MSNSCNLSLPHGLKVCALASLMVGASVCAQSQEIWPADTLCYEIDTVECTNREAESYEEALSISDSGDIVVIRGCSAGDFARFLNTTRAIARAILEDCNYIVSDDDSIVLVTGDTIRCSNADTPASNPCANGPYPFQPPQASKSE